MAKSRNLANTSSQGSTSNVIVVPTGTTAQRTSATAGFIRYNTDLNSLESANGTAWANVGSGGTSSGGSSSNVSSLTSNVFITSSNNVIISANTGLIDASNASIGFVIPTGTYTQRPTAAANGTIRWNSSNNWAEMYTGSNTGWVVIAYGGQYTITYLVVAGGGGGGNRHSGGGGAGGLITGTRLVSPGATYSVSIGAGGGGAPTGGGQLGSNGSDTTALGFTAIGGGGGSSYGDSSNPGPATASAAATSGGSGGGQGYNTPSYGSGTAGQGNPGGTNNGGVPGGGGGGSGATGSIGSGSSAGPGGKDRYTSVGGRAGGRLEHAREAGTEARARRRVVAGAAGWPDQGNE